MNLKIKTNKEAVVSSIWNEGMTEVVNSIAKSAKCRVIYTDCGTKAIIRGNITKFTKEWNKA